MTDALRPAPPARITALFAMTVFASASLVFLVQPMVTKLVLPLLGGSPAVWNAAQAFFQLALLVGYAYAHLLQRVKDVRRQALIHVLLLLAAALVLPLRVSDLLGQPSVDHPALWLVGVLALSIGAPFAVLSATAPLVQAWQARFGAQADGREPYSLYVASNLGSLLALLAYPLVVEPTLSLTAQRIGWSVGFGGFAVLIGVAALTALRGQNAPVAVSAPAADGPVRPVTAMDRLLWLLLAAAPSSLMLGATTHITTDIASAPFLWVMPLALYLLTFVFAFQTKPILPQTIVMPLQAAAVIATLVLLPWPTQALLGQVALQLATFFLTALICHQALYARRPDPSRLTEFYLFVSIGGVIGGGFNAFLAPVLFKTVVEYPLVLVLACLARPWDGVVMRPLQWVVLVISAAAAVAASILASFSDLKVVMGFAMAVAGVGAFILARSAVPFTAALAVLAFAAGSVADRAEVMHEWRSFFGVLRETRSTHSLLGGEVRMLAHGTTMHGAQAVSPDYRCQPLVYYAPNTPIGQVFRGVQARRDAVRIGAVGLGSGTVAAYVRPGDHLTFYEIDPLVVSIATDPKHFGYTSQCAKGPVDYVLGDARLRLDDEGAGPFDILLIDAFTSDSVPTHLLTVEAIRGYLQKLTPDGVLVLHLSNRNLDLRRPAQATAVAADGHALFQRYYPPDDVTVLVESSEDALIVTRSEAALAPFVGEVWGPLDSEGVRPWTDDYVNLPGSLWRNIKDRNGW